MLSKFVPVNRGEVKLEVILTVDELNILRGQLCDNTLPELSRTVRKAIEYISSSENCDPDQCDQCRY